MKIVTFNTHYGVRPSRRPPAQPFDLEQVLADLDADVIVLQELWRPDRLRGRADVAAERLGYEVLYEPTGSATSDHGWPRLRHDGDGESGIAVLSRPPARRVGALVVGPTLGDPAPRRSALDIEIELDDGRVRVIAVHLTSRLPHGPPLQLRRLAPLLPGPGTPAVVVGDCNFWGPGVAAMLPGWKRAVRGRTWPARAPHSQIDHVLVRPSDMTVHGGRVLGDVGSDHRPIEVDLSIVRGRE